ncbi:hypothetical protein [Streptomyces sp. NPDC090029]|uniref:hypothetical protein n=1 Tax=Streptomyces sp. NPDC090029 TaxID=3365924 RepID=UPI0037FDCD90
MLLLVGPDRRDRSFWVPTETSSKSTFFRSIRNRLWPIGFLTSPDMRHMGRMGWRFLTSLMLLAAFMALLSEHPWVACGAAGVLVVLLSTRLNVADHVITAAVRDQEREKLLDYLEDRLRWMRERCDKVVIVAHSQGGFLAHQLMARHGGRNQRKVIRLVGVGSGLKPIWILQQARRPFVAAVAWVLPLASICLAWGTSPLFEPSNSAVAAGMLMQLTATTSSLALPLAAQSPEFGTTMMQGVAESLERIQSGILLVGDMTWDRWTAIAVSGALTVACGLIIKFRIAPDAKAPFVLPTPNGAKPLKWHEYSSQHDMVGRMLLPTLPAGVEQEATPVLGHPLRDHTTYFDGEGLLTRRLAAGLLMDVDSSTHWRLGGRRWMETVARYERALRKQHDRRRCFQAVLMLWAAFAVLVPRMARGATLVEAVLAGWLPLGLMTVVLSVVFTWRGRRSHRKMVALLDAELRGQLQADPPVRIVPPEYRTTTSLSLAIGAVLAFYGALWLRILSDLHPAWHVRSPGAPLLAAILLATMSAAACSGYRVKRRWAAGAALLAALPALTSGGPIGLQASGWTTAPGGTLAATVLATVVVAVISLSRARVVPFPEAVLGSTLELPGQRMAAGSGTEGSVISVSGGDHSSR